MFDLKFSVKTISFFVDLYCYATNQCCAGLEFLLEDLCKSVTIKCFIDVSVY